MFPVPIMSNIQLTVPRSMNGFCTFCQKNTGTVCQRCGDFYCSVECQRRDWQRHRYICIPIPALIHASAFFDPILLERAQAQQNFASLMATAQQTNQNLANVRNLQTVGAATANVNANANANANVRVPLAQQPKPVPLPQKAQTSKNAAKQTKNENMHTNNKSNNNSNSKTNLNDTKIVSNNAQPIPDKITTNGKRTTLANEPLPVAELPKPGACVVLSGFCSPNRCFVREGSAAVNAAYFSVIEKISAYGKNAPVMKKKPSINTYALTKRDGVYHRVRILNTRHDNTMRVLFVDHGCVTVRNLDDLREISNEIQMLPQYAMRIQLKNVSNYAINDEINAFLAKFENEDYKIMYNENDKSEGMDLYNWLNDKHLNEELRKFCCNMQVYDSDNGSVRSLKLNKKAKSNRNDERTTPTQRSALVERLQLAMSEASLNDKLKPVLQAPFHTKHLPLTNEGINLFIVDNSNLSHGYLGCIALKDANLLALIQQYLLEFKDDKPYTPAKHEYVIAKYEGEWFRAKVMSSKVKDGETNYSVIYIDFTNESVLTNKDIRRYPADLTYDCYTSFCMISDLPTTLNEAQIEFLKSKMPINTTLHVDAISYPNEQLAAIKCDAIITEFNKNYLSDD